MLKHLMLVGIGGALGSMLRYLASFGINRLFPFSAFPWATFLVNISGCMLIGLLIGYASKYPLFNHELRYLLVVGFCGGYTTFSTFSAENVFLLEKGHYLTLAAYVIASVGIGILAFYMGQHISKN